jgi:soluble lytic murein transglycosylase-like protein
VKLTRLVFCQIFALVALFLGYSPLAWSVAAAPAKIDQRMLDSLKKSVESAESFTDRFDAEVWLLSKSGPLERYIKDIEERFKILRLVHREATRAGVSADLVLAVIQIESAFNPFAISHAGAQGMMQVMPFWKKEIGREQDSLLDLETNLRYGCSILRYYIDRERGRWPEGLARYNGSYGQYWYSDKVIEAWKKYWRR